MENKQITEKEALNTLIQVYLSHTSKWYSSVVTTLLGSIGFPLIAYNLQLSTGKNLDSIYLHLFSFMTVSFVVGTLYFSHKVIYSLQFLEELYHKLSLAENGKSLTDYRNKLMRDLRVDSLIFKFLVKRKKREWKKEYRSFNVYFISGFFLALLGGYLLLSFIWWPITQNWLFSFVWEGILLIFIVIYLLVKII